MKLLFFDIETTGFSRQYDFIIELAGIVYDTETKEKLAVFHEYIKPGKKIPIHITQVTGITNEMVADKDNEKNVMSRFIDFIREQSPDQFVGHNIDAFDNLWMKDKSIFYELSFPARPTIDTLKIARKKKVKTSKFTAKGNPSYTQESIAEAYGVVYEAHSAINDVEALIEIFEIIAGDDVEEPKAMPADRRRIKLGF